MNLRDIITRRSPPAPWAEGEKIPWHDPDFSERMLKVHLSQDHDWASRRFAVIDRHVEWIHRTLLAGQPTRLLDLGCGPGLYASRLAKLGHDCTGIDYSPASIAYAEERARAEKLSCRYLHGDIRTADYGTGYALVMLVFGEFNVFRPAEAEAILRKAYQALAEEGVLLLEAHTFAAVRDFGSRPASWYAVGSGLFSSRPHLCLNESFWDAERGAATERFYIVDAASGETTRYAASMQAYSEDRYRSLLQGAGFKEIEVHPGMDDEKNDQFNEELFAIIGRKR